MNTFFLGPKFRLLPQILVNDPFLALGLTVNFRPWKRFFDFLFRSYSCFRKKKLLTAQKVFPPPTVGVPSASKSPSALSAQALWARAGLITFKFSREYLCIFDNWAYLITFEFSREYLSAPIYSLPPYSLPAPPWKIPVPSDLAF